MAQTRAGAEELSTRMRRETAEDIRKMLSEIEMARSSAEDELETQRILTETARVRAFSHGLAAESAPEEMAKTNDNLATIGNLGAWEQGIQEAELKEAAPKQKSAPKRRKSSRRAKAKSSAKKAAAKKASKPVAKKPAAKKASKPAAKKPAAKKAISRKPKAKKAISRKPAALKAVAKKSAEKRSSSKRSAKKAA